jgi:hypothetical protein
VQYSPTPPFHSSGWVPSKQQKFFPKQNRSRITTNHELNFKLEIRSSRSLRRLRDGAKSLYIVEPLPRFHGKQGQTLAHCPPLSLRRSRPSRAKPALSWPPSSSFAPGRGGFYCFCPLEWAPGGAKWLWEDPPSSCPLCNGCRRSRLAKVCFSRVPDHVGSIANRFGAPWCAQAKLQWAPMASPPHCPSVTGLFFNSAYRFTVSIRGQSS